VIDVAEPLKNQFGTAVPRRIAEMISGVYPEFPADAFVREALEGYEALDLTPRGWRIAEALHHHLPRNYEEAANILLASLGPKLEATEGNGMSPFLYLPHVFFVAKYGLDHFDVSMHAQYELTQRFTAEFSIRRYLERYPDTTLARLEQWAHDESPHVRRLVSEGTRPRLPWAPRLREFQKDPRPVLALLELLKDDPELYVRRSVANNLNDIGKDHPSLLVETARAWMKDATEERRWLIRHALRSAVKRAEPGALEIMGYHAEANVSIDNVRITPARPQIGDSVEIAFEVTNTDSGRQRVLVDLRVHFVKANGKIGPKVFKLKTFEFDSNESVRLRKRIALTEMTTRKHYAGAHQVEVLLNGRARPIGAFDLVNPQAALGRLAGW
jgi:3-methyladenine DNA glycosylase AlkC